MRLRLHALSLLAAVAATAPAPVAAQRVALLATEPLGAETSLYLVEPDAALPAPVARFEHLPGASVQAAVLPRGTTVVAVADVTPARDLSFASGLVRLAPGAEPVWLCDRVVVASRPLVTPDGRLLVSRGRAGPERAGELRIDELTIDEVDPLTGRARTWHALSGYLLYLAGAHGREVFVYRVRPGGADVIALSPDGAVRVVVAALAAPARDFSVDASGGLVYQNLEGRRWVVERVAPIGQARARLADQAEAEAAPLVWPDGTVTTSADLRLLARSPDGRRAAALARAPGGLPVPLVIDTATGAARRLPAPTGRRVTLAGFVP